MIIFFYIDICQCNCISSHQSLYCSRLLSAGSVPPGFWTPPSRVSRPRFHPTPRLFRQFHPPSEAIQLIHTSHPRSTEMLPITFSNSSLSRYPLPSMSTDLKAASTKILNCRGSLKMSSIVLIKLILLIIKSSIFACLKKSYHSKCEISQI